MSYTLKHGSRGDISFASINLPGKSNEDTHCFNLSHILSTKQDLPSYLQKDFASFGVFDGHLGGYTSSLCESTLHPLIAEKFYSKLREAYEDEFIDPLGDLHGDDLEDLFLCQSINEAILELNKEAHAKDGSGSTCLSAFILPRTSCTKKILNKKREVVEVKSEGYYKVILSNIGDSRGLLILSDTIINSDSTPGDYIPMTPLSPLSPPNSLSGSRSGSGSFNLSLGDSSNNSIESTPQITASPSLQLIEEDLFLEEELVVDSLPLHEAQLSSHFNPTSYLSKISSMFVQVTEDHNLYCERERYRISQKISLLPQLLPYDISFQSKICRRLHNKVALDISSPSSVCLTRQSSINKFFNFSPTADREKSEDKSESLLIECPKSFSNDLETVNSCISSLEFSPPTSPSSRVNIAEQLKKALSSYNSIIFSNKINLELENYKYKTMIAPLKPYKDSLFSSILYLPSPLCSQILFYSQGYLLAPNGSDFDLNLDIQALAAFAKKLEDAQKYSIERQNRKKNFLDVEEKEVKNENGNPIFSPYQHDQFIFVPKSNDSFFAPRMNKSITGPVAFFSRVGNSILMTRSLGDLNGPRSCLPLPEITSFNVPYNRFSRLILATDGIWDVIDNETVRRMSLYYKFSSPSELAQAIAYKARRRRERYGMRIDDITVTVIDFSPDKGIFLKDWNNYPSKLYHGISAAKLDHRLKLKEKVTSKYILPLDISGQVNTSLISPTLYEPLIESKILSPNSHSETSCPVS